MTLAVLITYYNERGLLTECLESLLGQTVPVDEILVYDDASQAPAQDFVPSGLAVRVIRGHKNLGPASGRNVLLRETTADYVHFHDADDLFAPNWSKEVRSALRDSTPDVVLTEIASYRDGCLESERVLGLKRVIEGEDLTRFCIRGALLVPAGTYHRQSVLAIGGYRVQLWQSEDFDFHVRLAASGISYSVIDEPLVQIRLRSASRSQNTVEVWSSALDSIQSLSTELDRKYRCDLAERAAQAGAVLYRSGAKDEARRAFQIAQDLGPPSYQSKRLYGTIAQLFGAVAAERCSAIYRRFVPERSRRYLVERGW